jgi:hypothetical protein
MQNRISEMSVFNSSVPEQCNAVFNFDWSGFPRVSDIKRETDRVTASIDRSTQRMTRAVTDLGKDSKRTIDAIRKGSERVADAVKQAATTNASQNVPLSVRAIHRGLLDVSESANCIAQYLAHNPDEMGAATEAAEAVGERFSELVKATSESNEGNERLRLEVAEMEKTMDWVDHKFSHAGSNQPVTVNNSFLQYWSD